MANAMMVMCKNCVYFRATVGCMAYYPPAKCSGALKIKCKDFRAIGKPSRKNKKEEQMKKLSLLKKICLKMGLTWDNAPGETIIEGQAASEYLKTHNIFGEQKEEQK